jgi:hypothetical protein
MEKLKPILYYSNLCKHSQELLQYVSKTPYHKNMNFICIDNRFMDKNKQIQVVLEDNSHIPLPDIINKVPSLLLIHKNNMVILGNNIKQHIDTEMRQKPSQQLTEPESFDFGGGGGSGGHGYIQSDVYSFLDQSAEEMSAKGNGGLRQTYNYSTLDQIDDIITPPEDYNPNKSSKNESLDKLIQDRDKALAMKS